ncbi:MAG TPA: polyphosphate kinase 2 family protein [Acidimicrobiales bacterium]|nr:polyphosphate kinase 2 family protein [Acidimicrobiales bacterium]
MESYRVTKKTGFKLSKFDPGDTGELDPHQDGKRKAKAELAELNARLDSLQERLYADGHHKLLVVLQGMDTAGKGGTIRRVFEGVNPSGVRVAAFKAPSEVELAHDFLWRIHPEVPRNGELVIFDRSHYEDVLIVRVRELVPEERWRARYRHIREFEQMLVDEGTTIVKFFLHISRDEQAERLQARLDDPQKHWKFRLSDLAERKLWDDYQVAFEDAIKETSTPSAPWVIVPANRKWYRDVVVCRTLVETLEKLDLEYPPSPDDLTGAEIS